MDDDSPEVVLVGFIWQVLGSSQVFSSIGLHVQLSRIFQVGVYLYFSHLIVIKLESFDCNGKDVG